MIRDTDDSWASLKKPRNGYLDTMPSKHVYREKSLALMPNKTLGA